MDLNKLLAKLDGEKESASEIASAISHVGLFSALCDNPELKDEDKCRTEVIATAFALLKRCPAMSIYDALRESYDMWHK
jgi:hypothetical protein